MASISKTTALDKVREIVSGAQQGLDRHGPASVLEGAPLIHASILDDLTDALDASPHGLDSAWEQINALGGRDEPDNPLACGVNQTVDRALEIIEALCGMDPIQRRAQASA